MSPLTPPAFLETSPAALVDDLVASFEATTGRTLYPAQVERLLVDLITYREALVRQAIQGAAEQSFVAFATGTFLESLGLLLGVSGRLPATAATTTWTITLTAAEAVDHVYAAGWTAMDPNGKAWKTTADVTIPAGSLAASVAASAVDAGIAQNGIPAGSVFSPLEGTASVSNLTATAGGAEQETDDQLRTRILQAPFGFSVAGSAGSYRFHALGAHPSLIDVAVANIAPGQVGVYPLTKDGLPSQAVMDAVTAALSAEDVRPLCDLVTVAPPTRLGFVLEANITVFSTADTATVQAAVEAAAEAYIADRRVGLGRDLIASQVIKALSLEGVYKVDLVAWADHVLGPSEWADGVPVIHMVGSANG